MDVKEYFGRQCGSWKSAGKRSCEREGWVSMSRDVASLGGNGDSATNQHPATNTLGVGMRPTPRTRHHPSLLRLEAKGSPPQEPTKAPTLLFPYPSTIPLTVHLRIHCEPADGGERRTGRRVSQPERARAHPWPRRGTYCSTRCRADTSVTNVDVPLVLLMAMYRCWWCSRSHWGRWMARYVRYAAMRSGWRWTGISL